jgi:hypothetical protein
MNTHFYFIAPLFNAWCAIVIQNSYDTIHIFVNSRKSIEYQLRLIVSL